MRLRPCEPPSPEGLAVNTPDPYAQVASPEYTLLMLRETTHWAMARESHGGHDPHGIAAAFITAMFDGVATARRCRLEHFAQSKHLSQQALVAAALSHLITDLGAEHVVLSEMSDGPWLSQPVCMPDIQSRTPLAQAHTHAEFAELLLQEDAPLSGQELEKWFTDDAHALYVNCVKPWEPTDEFLRKHPYYQHYIDGPATFTMRPYLPAVRPARLSAPN